MRGRNLIAVSVLLSTWAAGRVLGPRLFDDPQRPIALASAASGPLEPAPEKPVVSLVASKLETVSTQRPAIPSSAVVAAFYVSSPQLRAGREPVRLGQTKTQHRATDVDWGPSVPPSPIISQTNPALTQLSSTSGGPPPMSGQRIGIPPNNASPLRASTWLLLRPQVSGSSLSNTGGALGGSQIGFRISAPFAQLPGETEAAFSVRAYAPLEARRGKELAAGLSLKRGRRVSAELIAERRIAIDKGGRSAFATLAVVGTNDVALPLNFRLNAYGQAGIVGLRSHDAFGDAALAADRPLGLGRVRVGAGIWAAAQPGVSRMDIGPQLIIPLSIGPQPLRASAQWRFRVAGRAAPASGPALTLGTDF